MKILRYICVLAVISACVGCTTIGRDDLAKHDYLVKSWKSGVEGQFLTIIENAHASAKNWVQSPELFAQNIMGFSELKEYSILFSADRIEANTQATIFVFRDGFLDDSVRGDLHEFVLEKIAGRWQLKSAKQAYRCWRAVDESYSADECS